jgi:hypothetical protein
MYHHTYRMYNTRAATVTGTVGLRTGGIFESRISDKPTRQQDPSQQRLAFR